MRALVIGGTGFVGANLVAGLTERGLTTRVLYRKSSSLVALAGLEFEMCIGNILDEPNTLIKAMSNCDWVFHTAALTPNWYRNHFELYKVNVDGTKNVLAAACEAGVKRFVFTSSLGAMCLPAHGELLNESSQFNLKPEEYPYGHSKYLAEQEVLRAVSEGLQAVIVNPTAIIGPDIHQLTSSIVYQVAKGHVPISLPGGLNFVAVEDVVAGHLAAIEQGRVGDRYILAGENLSYRKVVEIVSEVVGRKPPHYVLPIWAIPTATLAVAAAGIVLGNRLPLEPEQVHMSGNKIYADGSKAIREFNLPQTPFREAVQRTYDWYRKHGYL